MENKTSIIYKCIIVLCIIFICILLRTCYSNNKTNDILQHNIEALTDSIHYYTTENNELVASKKLLIADNNNLKYINDSLYNDLKDMKIKNAELALKLDAIISRPPSDTTYIFDTTFLYKDFLKEFNFIDNYRTLCGNIEMKNNNLSLNILKDEVYFNYTIAIENNTVYLKSNNPYIKYNNILGTIENKKEKKFSVGVNIGFGTNYDIISKNIGIGPYLGVGFTYNFILF